MNQITEWNITRIPYDELRRRRERALREIEAHKAEGVLFFSAGALQYLTGVQFIETERPIVLILKGDGRCIVFAPLLEQEHIERCVDGLERVVSYREYPGAEHPMCALARLLEETGLADKTVCADSDGYGFHFGYSGPALSSLCPSMNLIRLPQLIPFLKRIKSPYDITVIREVTRWANLAHALLYEYTRPGLKELEVVHRVMAEATRAMLLTLGPAFNPGADIQAAADYRGQIGKDSYYPHALCANSVFKTGDILGTRARASMLGYGSELERCMFLGEPSREMRTYYNHVISMQDIAFSVIRPGIPCSIVDKEVTRYYEEHNLMEYWRHHTGHALGLGKHEAPFFDSYDDTIIEPGMVFSVEPGLYVKGLGGFRLSDTVLVTGQGIERITYYPREIDRVIIL
jgi:Xaa-Pro aminopeptidase